MRTERGDITTGIRNMIVRGYYEQPYANKLYNLEERDKFLGTYNLLRLNHEKIENTNRPIMNEVIELITKNLPTKKNPGPGGFTLVNSTKN